MRDANSLFETRVLRHMDAAYNLARWYLKDDADAEDAVQDAMIRAHQAFARLREADCKPWLLQIVRNVCLRRLDRRRRAPAQIPDDLDIPCLADYSDPEAALIKAADAEAVRQAIDSLPEALREVLVLREFEDMTYSEIAAVVGVPAGTVMSRLSRARVTLAASMRGNVPEVNR